MFLFFSPHQLSLYNMLYISFISPFIIISLTGMKTHKAFCPFLSSAIYTQLKQLHLVHSIPQSVLTESDTGEIKLSLFAYLNHIFFQLLAFVLFTCQIVLLEIKGTLRFSMNALSFCKSIF